MKRVLILLLACAAAATAQNPNLGTSGAQFLQIGVGARPMALAGAAVAGISDATALFWNPAGTANIQGQSLHFSTVSLWSTIRLNSVAYAVRMGENGTLGLSATVLSMDAMEVTTEQQPDGTGETFDARDLMLAFSYARPLTDRFNAGVSVKYIHQSIWNETASGIAFDAGTQYKLWFNDFTIGMSLTNFGGDLRMEGRDLRVKYDKNPSSSGYSERLAPAQLETEEYPLPLHFQVGVSAVPYKDEKINWLVALDVAHPNDNAERVNVGTELGFFGTLFVRGGYRYHYDQEDWTLGAGCAIPFGDGSFSVDYAYARYTLLPAIHRLSLGLNF